MDLILPMLFAIFASQAKKIRLCVCMCAHVCMDVSMRACNMITVAWGKHLETSSTDLYLVPEALSWTQFS